MGCRIHQHRAQLPADLIPLSVLSGAPLVGSCLGPFGQFSYWNAPSPGALTPSRTWATMIPMPVPSISSERRSTRIFLRLRVVVAGKNSDGRRFREACETIVINAHGGLLYLNQPVTLDSMLVIANPFTQEEQECRIVYLGDAVEKGQRVGVEFLSPAPHFWGVELAPGDWSGRSQGSADGSGHPPSGSN